MRLEIILVGPDNWFSKPWSFVLVVVNKSIDGVAASAIVMACKPIAAPVKAILNLTGLD